MLNMWGGEEMLPGQPHDCGCDRHPPDYSKDAPNHMAILVCLPQECGQGRQLQCDHGSLPWSIDRCASHAAEPILAVGSNGEAPAKPAFSDDHAQVDGMNWYKPDAPDAGL